MFKFLSRICLLMVLLLTTYPFLWMFFSSFKTNQEIYRTAHIIPKFFNFFAYKLLFSNDLIKFDEVLLRSLFLSGGQAVLACLVTAATGYAIAVGRFWGKRLLFLAAMLLILYPKQALSLFLFEWMVRLGITGSLYGLLFSGVASGLGVVFFAQVFKKIPPELVDLARLEGKSDFGCFLTFLPLVKPALITYGILHFLLSWQEHLLPLLVLKSDELTLPLALAKLSDSSYRIPEAVGLAAGVVALLPMLILFGISFKRIRSALSDWVVS